MCIMFVNFGLIFWIVLIIFEILVWLWYRGKMLVDIVFIEIILKVLRVFDIIMLMLYSGSIFFNWGCFNRLVIIIFFGGIWWKYFVVFCGRFIKFFVFVYVLNVLKLFWIIVVNIFFRCLWLFLYFISNKCDLGNFFMMFVKVISNFLIFLVFWNLLKK